MNVLLFTAAMHRYEKSSLSLDQEQECELNKRSRGSPPHWGWYLGGGCENFLNFQVKYAGFYAFYCEKTTCSQKLWVGCLINPLGAEDVKCTGVENLAGGSIPATPCQLTPCQEVFSCMVHSECYCQQSRPQGRRLYTAIQSIHRVPSKSRLWPHFNVFHKTDLWQDINGCNFEFFFWKKIAPFGL